MHDIDLVVTEAVNIAWIIRVMNKRCICHAISSAGCWPDHSVQAVGGTYPESLLAVLANGPHGVVA